MADAINSPEIRMPTVGFPTTPARKANKKILLLVLGIPLLIALVAGFFIFVGSRSEATPSPTPASFVQGLEEEVLQPTPTPTPRPVAKNAIKIEVLNGTGVAGEAAYLQSQLASLGYTEVKVGNFENDDQTVTSVTFSATLPEEMVSEITKKLTALYKEVETKTGRVTGGRDVQIIIGPRKGVATPRPTLAPTSTPTPKP